MVPAARQETKMKANTPRNPAPQPAPEPKPRVGKPTTWRFTDWAAI